VQLSFGGNDYLIDPLAGFDLAPLACALTDKEIVLQGADFDLRLLRRSMNFVGTRIFDTVIAARLLGIREFSLAHWLEILPDRIDQRFAEANWAPRPLPDMAEP
jgi:ribonuclease D